MFAPIALPINEEIQDDFDRYSNNLALAVPEIAKGCMDYLSLSKSQKELNATHEARNFARPFQRDPESAGRHSGRVTAQQLWFELNMISDFVMDWVDEIFLEPSRHAMAGVPR